LFWKNAGLINREYRMSNAFNTRKSYSCLYTFFPHRIITVVYTVFNKQYCVPFTTKYRRDTFIISLSNTVRYFKRRSSLVTTIRKTLVSDVPQVVLLLYSNIYINSIFIHPTLILQFENCNWKLSEYQSLIQ